MIYFIQNERTGDIKIGRSTDPSRRLAGFQTAVADRLKMLGTLPGGHVLNVETRSAQIEPDVCYLLTIATGFAVGVYRGSRQLLAPELKAKGDDVFLVNWRLWLADGKTPN